MVLSGLSVPNGLHLAPFVMSLQAHPMSRAKLIFLVALVVFFTCLFIGTYIWMRRPNFGQGGAPSSEVHDVGMSGESRPTENP